MGNSSSEVKHELKDEIFQAIKDRTIWQERQATWYKMRHQGLRRVNKPHPNAADLHFPLIDALIEKIKPFYFQQLYATEQFATFVSLRSQPPEATSAVAQWFDYRLKQKTNLEREIMGTIDNMCMAGRAVLKPRWISKEKRIDFNAIDPIYFIVPQDTVELGDAPWCVHVIHLSKEEYKANKDFRQDKEFVKSLAGTGDEIGESTDTKWIEVKRREGLTYSKNENKIILWEIYRRDGDDVWVETYSPYRLETENEVRPKYLLGSEYKGKYPFISFRTEIKDQGWYSPRGISEKVAAFEDSLCRLWNGKHDCMDYYNRPMFKNSGQLSNTGVTRFLPGSTLPQGVEPVQFPAPPFSFDEEMQSTRALAEYLIGIPDLSSTQHMVGQGAKRGEVTATQINAIIGQSGLSDDMRARVFRQDLADLYRMCWNIYKAKDSDSLVYLLNDEQLEVPLEALQGEYAITPNGSSDSWNKPLQLQKAVARKQMFTGSPYIQQGELDKSILEIDDPRLIKRLYQDPGDELKNQMEAQAQEISIMMIGFPANVNRGDDDGAHLQSIQGFVDRRIQAGEPITPELARLLVQHGAEHDQAMQQKKNKMIGQIRQQMAPMIQYLGSIAMQQPENVVSMGGAASPTSASPTGGATSAPTPMEQAKDQQDSATKLLNALTNASKAGVPITEDQLNQTLAQAGLPPLQITAPIVPQQTQSNP